jgi:farnesyl diphosphate synthase
MSHSLNIFFADCQKRSNLALASVLPSVDRRPKRLHQAMHYSVFNGGKRFRPILVYAVGTTQNVDFNRLDAVACSLELIHSYSLVHDDLPAMDDDDLRRGKPTCHKQFDEATAVLVGDALQAFAFDVLLNHNSTEISAEKNIEIMRILSYASGSMGMAGGQAIDLESSNQTLSLRDLEEMHQKKTGALITASIKMACQACNINDTEVARKLEKYSHCLGLNFQITDDILDIEGETEVIGKPRGSDIKAQKATFPAILGLEETKTYAQQIHEKALDELNSLSDSYDILRDISFYILNRSH